MEVNLKIPEEGIRYTERGSKTFVACISGVLTLDIIVIDEEANGAFNIALIFKKLVLNSIAGYDGYRRPITEPIILDSSFEYKVHIRAMGTIEFKNLMMLKLLAIEINADNKTMYIAIQDRRLNVG
jgi:hypothetical protein